MKHLGELLVGFVVLLCLWNTSFAAPLDLSSFTADPGVVAVGSSATFTEDFDVCLWYLYNDNFYVEANATILSFDYSLSYGQNDYDDSFVFDMCFFTELEVIVPSSDHFEIDLTAYRGTEISLAWGLVWGGEDSDAGTTANISNVDLVTEGAQHVPVPEPATMTLLGAGLIGLAGFKKKGYIR